MVCTRDELIHFGKKMKSKDIITNFRIYASKNEIKNEKEIKLPSPEDVQRVEVVSPNDIDSINEETIKRECEKLLREIRIEIKNAESCVEFSDYLTSLISWNSTSPLTEECESDNDVFVEEDDGFYGEGPRSFNTSFVDFKENFWSYCSPIVNQC